MKPVLFLALFLATITSGILLAYGGGSVTDLLSVTGASPPIITAVTINGNSSTITLVPNATMAVNVDATISDNGGCTRIAGGTTTILLYRSGIGSSTCATTPNNANCYIANAVTASSTCTTTSVNTTTTFAVWYYAQATDSSSSYPGQNWQATVTFTDPTSATGTADSTNVSTTNDMATLLGLNSPSSTINYGTLMASSTTGSTNQLLNIENAGNASTTLQVSGTGLRSGSNSIATSSQHYATSSFTFGGNEQQLSTAATTITGINIAPVLNFPIGGGGWQNTTAFPNPTEVHALVASRGYLYATAGYSNGNYTSTVLFAPINATGSIGAWSSTTALPYIDYFHTSVAYGGYLYTIGGVATGGSVITSTVLFAPVNASGSIGAWSSTQALPYGVNLHASVAYGGYLYTVGGQDPIDGVTSTVLFAPVNATGSIGAWSSTTALPYTLDDQPVVAYSNYLYVIGGAVNGGGGTSTVLFAPINATGSIGAWSSTTALPYVDSAHTSAVYDGYLYVVAGYILSQTSTVLFAPINATGSIGAWSSTQALPYAVSAHASALYNGWLYTSGGYTPSSGGVTSTVIFTPLNARSTYWGVTVPSTAGAGSYSAVTTITAVFSP